MQSSEGLSAWSIWAEWDLGVEGCLFSTREKAEAAIAQFFGEDGELEMTVEEAQKGGLLRFDRNIIR